MERKTLSGHCLHVNVHITGLELTFTGINAFRPSVINFFGPKSPAILEPITARSATTDPG